MAGVRRKNHTGLLIIFGAVIILTVSNPGEAKIWHRIRDFFFPRRTCRTTECGEAAQTILNNRNSTVKPCDDFYEFTCGGWLAAHPVPENKTKWNQFQEATNRTHDRIRKILEKEGEENDPEYVKKARQVYRACLNSDANAEENMQVLVDRLAVWGGWPIATENWDERKFNWKKLLVNLILTNNLSPLFTIEISLDRKNTSNAAVIIDQGDIRFCHDHFTKDNRIPMQEWISKIARKIAKATNQNVTEDDVTKDALDLIVMEVGLCQSLKTVDERQNEFRLYNPKTLKELQNFTDSGPRNSQRTKVNWVALMKDALAESDVDINEDFTVIVTEPDYLLKLLSIIDTMTPRTIANYMLWQKIAYLHGEISEEFRRMGFEYAEYMTGVSGVDPRWRTCVEYTNENMEHATGYEYVTLYFGKDEKKMAQELVTHILESFIEDLKKMDWMGAKTRALAVEKAENMVVAVGYPDWYNRTNIDNHYKDYIVGNSHLVNMENLKLADNIRGSKMLNKPMDLTIIFGGPAEVNAYYAPGANMMLIPAGIFQEPFYIKGRPEAMNYGGIGVVIGHEISHAFDVRGRLADKFGNLAQWWDETTLKTYHVKQECVEKQYAEYPIPEVATDEYVIKRLNGASTVGENIADNGGLQQAFKAYKRYVDENGSESRLPGLKDYSPEQLFFIAFATVWCESSTPQSIIDHITGDVHTPSKYRVLIPLENLEEFAGAWKCQYSDIKVTQKCTFW